MSGQWGGGLLHGVTSHLLFTVLKSLISDDNIDETYGVNVQFESDEEVSDKAK